MHDALYIIVIIIKVQTNRCSGLL